MTLLGSKPNNNIYHDNYHRFVADVICFEYLTKTHFPEAKETIVNLM